MIGKKLNQLTYKHLHEREYHVLSCHLVLRDNTNIFYYFIFYRKRQS